MSRPPSIQRIAPENICPCPKEASIVEMQDPIDFADAVIPAVHVAAREALLYQARKDLSILAWNAVQRITPEVAAQEPQSIAEMVAHLQAMQRADFADYQRDRAEDAAMVAQYEQENGA